ncbi:MAG: hypothetical protein V1746_03355 [bacterium]
MGSDSLGKIKFDQPLRLNLQALAAGSGLKHSVEKLEHGTTADMLKNGDRVAICFYGNAQDGYTAAESGSSPQQIADSFLKMASVFPDEYRRLSQSLEGLPHALPPDGSYDLDDLTFDGLQLTDPGFVKDL